MLTVSSPATTALNSLLQLLASDHGWRLGKACGPLFREDRFTVYVLAERRGSRILLCESAIGLRMPDYAQRRAWRLLLPECAAITVFTDSARSAFVWTRGGGIPHTSGPYVEYRLPDRFESLIRLHRDARGLDRVAERAPTLDAATSDRALACVVERMALRHGPPFSARTSLLRWIENLDEVGRLRETWQILRKTAILDPGCGDGDWLLRVAAFLEPIYDAVLDRMRSWVDDAGAARKARRPEHLGDLKTAVAAAEDRQLHPSQRVYVRRLLVRRHLFGAERSTGALRRCRKQLLSYAGLDGGGPLVHLDANVRLYRGDACEQKRWAHALRSAAKVPDVALPADLREEVEVLSIAWRAVRNRHLLQNAPLDELNRATVDLERRRRRVARQLASAGSGAFDLRLEFPAAMEIGRFNLIREME